MPRSRSLAELVERNRSAATKALVQAAEIIGADNVPKPLDQFNVNATRFDSEDKVEKLENLSTIGGLFGL